MRRSLLSVLILGLLTSCMTPGENGTGSTLVPPMHPTASPSPKADQASLDLPGATIIPAFAPLGQTVAHALSPDGTALAFLVFPCGGCDPELFIMDLYTWEVQELSTFTVPDSPIWAPNNLSVGYYDFDRGIRLINRSTGNESFLTTGQIIGWSPDGDTIAVGENSDLSAGEPYEFEIRILDLSAGTERQMLQRDGWLDWYAGLRWSPDGRYIAFACETEGFQSVLHLCDIDARETILLASKPVLGPHILGWTTDGQWLAIESGEVDGAFLRRDGACWSVPPVLEGTHWQAFSGQSSRLLVWYEGSYYVVDLQEALGSGFPEDVLSCP